MSKYTPEYLIQLQNERKCDNCKHKLPKNYRSNWCETCLSMIKKSKNREL